MDREEPRAGTRNSPTNEHLIRSTFIEEDKLMAVCACGFGAAAEQQFDARRAARDTARYRKSGADPTTRLLRSALAAQGRIEGSLLDVGCGIGALTFELLNAGISRATGVDASTAYLAAASDEAARSGRLSAVEFVHGDF
jgi:2-polyprenyl-3-methyl-5-hydroxy-6-metoxy-1,4-benzoquinol methylase